ncbi:MAG: hypothetical protein GY711_06470 [bacterium]|nr:hypothetical protein [bacterium]
MHRSLSHTTLAFALPLALAPPAVSQGIQTNPNVRRGPLSALAAGLSISEFTRTTTTDPLLVKEPLDQTGSPIAWNTTTTVHPADYTLMTLFPDDYDAIEINAMSTGNDVIPPIDEFGTPNVTAGTGRWFGMIVSLTNDMTGTPGSVVEARQAAGPVGADLFSHYWVGSRLAGPLVGATLFEMGREHIGLEAGAELDAVDLGLGVNAFDTPPPTSPPNLFFGHQDRFYFSVSTDCVGNLSQPFAKDQSGVGVNADAAVIYEMIWDDPTTGILGWGDITVYRDRGQLNLHPTDPAEDVDAVAVDRILSTIIFSTQPAGTRSQLQVLRHDTSTGIFIGPVPLTDRNRVEVTEHFSLQSSVDDFDGVCTVDPESFQIGARVGTPQDSSLSGPPPMGISVTRDANNYYIRTDGGARASDGVKPFFVYYYAALPGDLFTPLASALPGPNGTFLYTIPRTSVTIPEVRIVGVGLYPFGMPNAVASMESLVKIEQ